MVGVRDEQPIALLVRQHLARELQSARLERLALGLERERLSQRPLLRVDLEEAVDGIVQRVAVTLPGNAADDIAFGIDHDDGRPRVYTVRRPDRVVAVDGDGVADVVTEHGVADVPRVLLLVELAGVDADHHQRLVLVLLLQVFQVRKDVHAVDAAVGPEVEDDNAAAQVLDGDGLVRVEPAVGAREVGGADPGVVLGRGVVGGPGLRRRNQQGGDAPAHQEPLHARNYKRPSDKMRVPSAVEV